MPAADLGQLVATFGPVVGLLVYLIVQTRQAADKGTGDIPKQIMAKFDEVIGKLNDLDDKVDGVDKSVVDLKARTEERLRAQERDIQRMERGGK